MGVMESPNIFPVKINPPENLPNCQLSVLLYVYRQTICGELGVISNPQSRVTYDSNLPEDCQCRWGLTLPNPPPPPAVQALMMISLVHFTVIHISYTRACSLMHTSCSTVTVCHRHMQPLLSKAVTRNLFPAGGSPVPSLLFLTPFFLPFFSLSFA